MRKATGNGALELVVDGLWDQRAELWGRMQRHFHTPALALQTIRDHRAIAKALAAHDAAAARAAMHRHLARVVREFQRETGRRRGHREIARGAEGQASRHAAPPRRGRPNDEQRPQHVAPRRRDGAADSAAKGRATDDGQLRQTTIASRAGTTEEHCDETHDIETSLVHCAAAAAMMARDPRWRRPVTLNIVDVAGNLALTQDAIEAYRNKHPNLVAKINFTKAPAPELPGKLKAMQGAGRSDIDLVLTGTDVLGRRHRAGPAGCKILPRIRGEVPGLSGTLICPPRRKMQDLAQDQGIDRRVHAGGSADRIQPRQGQAAADDRAGAARVVQGQSRTG